MSKEKTSNQQNITSQRFLKRLLETPTNTIRGFKTSRDLGDQTISNTGINYYQSIKIDQMINKNNRIKSLKRF